MMRLVIFDCDGTLVDSQAIIVAAMARTFEARGLADPGREATLSIVGLSLKEAMAALVPEADEATVTAMAEGYRQSYLALKQEPALKDALYPGARETVTALAGRPDVMLGIATGKSRRGVAALLQREAFEGLFVTIQTADDAPSKPHPAMVHQAMAEVGAGPDDTVMIGDTAYDMAMARAAGAGAIGVTWGYHPRQLLLDAGSHTLVDRFADLVPAIDLLRRETA
jgi:phosphoglycolate phosphatase